MLRDKEKDWLLKKIDEGFPRGEGEPAHPLFQFYKENDKVHDLVWRLIETQGIKRFYECVIAGLIITPIVRALTILSVFGALVATSIGLSIIYGICRIINRLSKPKKRSLNEKNQKIIIKISFIRAVKKMELLRLWNNLKQS